MEDDRNGSISESLIVSLYKDQILDSTFVTAEYQVLTKVSLVPKPSLYQWLNEAIPDRIHDLRRSVTIDEGSIMKLASLSVSEGSMASHLCLKPP